MFTLVLSLRVESIMLQKLKSTVGSVSTSGKRRETMLLAIRPFFSLRVWDGTTHSEDKFSFLS